MKTTNYNMDTVIDLMASGILQDQEAMNAIKQAFYNQHCRIVDQINRNALDEGCPPASLLRLPDAPEPFEIDFSCDNPLDID